MKKESTKYQRISLLETLLQKKEWTKSNLLLKIEAETGEPIDERTLARYLKEISQNRPDFVRKDNQIGRESTFSIQLKDTWIDSDSIVAFKKMCQEVESTGNAQYKELLDHVGQFLEHRSIPQKLQQSDKHWLISHGPFAINPESLSANPALNKIISAIDKKQTIRIGKYTSSADQDGLVEFYPLKMVLRIGQLYVMGYGKKDLETLRTLRLDRMKGIIQILSESVPEIFYSTQHAKKIESFYKYKFAQWSNDEQNGEVQTVVLKSNEPWFLRHMKDSSFDPPAKIDAMKNTVSLKLYLTIDFERWLAGRIVTGACEVIAPKSLVSKMHNFMVAE